MGNSTKKYSCISHIGIYNRDGSMDVISCSTNGSLEHNGDILFRHYSNLEKMRELVSLVPIYYLGASIHPGSASHSYETPEEGVVVAYHRDKKETYTPPQHFASHDEYVAYMRGKWDVEYVYLYGEEFGRWSWTYIEYMEDYSCTQTLTEETFTAPRPQAAPPVVSKGFPDWWDERSLVEKAVIIAAAVPIMTVGTVIKAGSNLCDRLFKW